MTASMRSTRRVDWLSAIVLVSAGLATAMQSLHGDVGVPQLSSNSGQVHLDDASAARVNVELYMEALCPYCAGFVREQLGDVMRELSDLVDLTLVPFGNAQVQKDGTIKCQHGEDECLGNKILSCAMEKHPKQDQWFLFAWCCEHSHATTSPMMDAAARCADKIGWGFSAIKECVEGAPLQQDTMLLQHWSRVCAHTQRARQHNLCLDRILHRSLVAMTSATSHSSVDQHWVIHGSLMCH